MEDEMFEWFKRDPEPVVKPPRDSSGYYWEDYKDGEFSRFNEKGLEVATAKPSGEGRVFVNNSNSHENIHERNHTWGTYDVNSRWKFDVLCAYVREARKASEKRPRRAA